MSRYRLLGAYWEIYSNIESTSAAMAAAGTSGTAGGPSWAGLGSKPLFGTFFGLHTKSRSGTHLGPFLIFCNTEPFHLLAVVSDTRLLASFLSSILKGFRIPT